jgi:hypothetical protein
MNTSDMAVRTRTRRRRVSKETARGFNLQKALQILSSPICWVMCLLFFVAATPFELESSGFGYLIKACAMLGIVAYAVFIRGAQTGGLNGITIAVVVLLFLTNLSGWSDRIVVAIIAIVAGTLLGQTRGKKWNDEFPVIIIVYLAVHCIGLLVATFVFYSTGQVLELHSLIFPRESRIQAFDAIVRVSGFHNEPGTYSHWMLMTIYLFALTQGRLYNIWIAIIAASVVLTLSLWGVLASGVIAVAFVIEVLMSPGKNHRIRSVLSLILFCGILITLALSASTNSVEQGLAFLKTKGEMNSQSGMDKLYAMEFMRREFWNVFILGRPFFPGFAPHCVSPQDSGIGMTSIYYMGFLPFASLIFFLAARIYTRWGISFVVPIALIWVWKAHLYEPIVWVIIGYVLKGPIHKGLVHKGHKNMQNTNRTIGKQCPVVN